jgi:hypothetical protein
MDALNLFPGVNVGMVAGIIGILLGVKAVAQDKLPKWSYIVAVMVLGFVASAVVISPWTWKGWVASGISHAGAASILYQFGKIFIPAKT